MFSMIMWGWIEYLNDPYLVVSIQRYFGVKGISCANHQILTQVKRGRVVNRKLNEECYSSDRSTNLCIGHVPVKCSNGIQSQKQEAVKSAESVSDPEGNAYIITNWFWYYLFAFGTELGDEIFYATFIPFWFWNIDGAVGRRVVMVWTIIMYIGQGIKDIVCMPRPASPPVFRLQKKWALEYGMPSTHAMVGVSIPLSVLLYTMYRYQYPVAYGVVFALLWCSIISVSRLYLGMHSVLDIVAGLVLAGGLMLPVVPLVDCLDHFWLTSRWSPLIVLTVGLAIIVFYPSCGKWTPTRGDTTMVVGVCIGVHIGAWTNYQLGEMSLPLSQPPYTIIWPTYDMIGLSMLRTVLGFSCIVATRAACKWASYATLCAVLHLNSTELRKTHDTHANRAKTTVEIGYKMITYLLLGFNTLYLLPSVFRLLRIERPTFYTEI